MVLEISIPKAKIKCGECGKVFVDWSVPGEWELVICKECQKKQNCGDAPHNKRK